jgi:hypothetical protein
MSESAVVRRSLLKAGVFALLSRPPNALAWSKEGSVATSGAQEGPDMKREEMIRSYYFGWEKKHWNTVESVLADDFTFTSPNNDDHINKRAFKDRCWVTADWIDTIKMECVIVRGDDGFAKYLLTTTAKKSLRKHRVFPFKDEKVSAIEVYFGGKQGYPGQEA